MPVWNFAPLTNTTLWHKIGWNQRSYLDICFDELRPIHIEERLIERNKLIPI